MNLKSTLLALFVSIFAVTSFESSCFADVDQSDHRLLSPKDQRTLKRGEISDTRYITGGVVGSVVGFGSGQAIQGIYREHGWFFTAGEGGSLALMLLANPIFGTHSEHDRENYGNGQRDLFFGLGVIGLVGFRIVDIIDLWFYPLRLNSRYRELKGQAANHSSVSLIPVVIQKSPGLGVVASF